MSEIVRWSLFSVREEATRRQSKAKTQTFYNWDKHRHQTHTQRERDWLEFINCTIYTCVALLIETEFITIR